MSANTAQSTVTQSRQRKQFSRSKDGVMRCSLLPRKIRITEEEYDALLRAVADSHYDNVADALGGEFENAFYHFISEYR